MEVRTGYWWRNLREIDHLEDLSVDGRIILKCLFKKWNMEYLQGCSCSEQGHIAGSWECGNEPPGSTTCRKILDQLRTCQLLKKGLCCVELDIRTPHMYPLTFRNLASYIPIGWA